MWLVGLLSSDWLEISEEMNESKHLYVNLSVLNRRYADKVEVIRWKVLQSREACEVRKGNARNSPSSIEASKH